MANAQYDLWGTLQPAPSGLNRDQKVAYILEHAPATRDDDRELMLEFWRVFDSMDEALGAEAAEAFRAWFRKATHPETIRRGRAGLQRLRDGGGSLLPTQGEAERRRALDGAGPPGRW